MRKADDIWTVLVLVQLSQIANNVASGIGNDAMGIDSSSTRAIGEDGNGLWTDAVLFVQTLHTEEEGILRIGETGRVADGDGPCGFGEDVLRRRVDERDNPDRPAHPQGAILSDGSKERTRSQRRRGGFASFGIDDVSGDVVGSKISVALAAVSGFKASTTTSPSHAEGPTLPMLANGATPALNPMHTVLL